MIAGRLNPSEGAHSESDVQRVWFITGASSGFGHALVATALGRGNRAVIGARRTATLEQLASRHPDQALAVAVDVTDAAARERAVEAAVQRFGRIDVLANIAGRGSLGAAEEFSLAQLRDRMDLNFFAAAEMTRAVLPTMRAPGEATAFEGTTVQAVGG
jgi:NADP-dependent 3-hydroxy acid dehydrogenase YdfG